MTRTDLEQKNHSTVISVFAIMIMISDSLNISPRALGCCHLIRRRVRVTGMPVPRR